MEKGRLEAFTDGVIAVVITIMVLELKAPHEATWQAVFADWPVFLSYLQLHLRRHLLEQSPSPHAPGQAHINGKVMWANWPMLFWVSLFPFTTAWLNEAHGEHGEYPRSVPTLVYGVVLLDDCTGVDSAGVLPHSRPTADATARSLASRGRLEGEKISPDLSHRHCARVFRAHSLLCAIRGRVGDLARTRPAHRKSRDGEQMILSCDHEKALLLRSARRRARGLTMS